MATLLELAQFSNGAYTGGAPSGWAALEPSDPNDNGYYGHAYKNDVTREIVITNRGTRPTSLDDLLSDLQLALHIATPAQEDAARYVLQIANNPNYSGYRIIETGHSLGGNNAQAATVALTEAGFPVSAVTFNSPGIGGYPVSGDPASYNVLNLSAQSDAIHLAGGVHLGTSATLPAGPDSSKLILAVPLAIARGPVGIYLLLGKLIWNIVGPAHSIDTMVSYLERENASLGRNNWPGSVSLPDDSTGTEATTTPDGTLILTDANGNAFQTSTGPDGTINFDYHADDGEGNTISGTANSTGAATYAYQGADGSYGSLTDDGQGRATRIYQNADGSGGSSTDDGNGNIESRTIDAAGVTTEIRKYSNGDYTVSTDEGNGNTIFSAIDDGVVTHMFAHADGSHGSSIDDGDGNTTFEWYANGFTINVHYNADGSSVESLDDGNGAVISNILHADGSMTKTNRQADGAYSSVTDDGKGNFNVIQVASDGTVLNSFYQRADGTGGGMKNDGQGRITQLVLDNGTLIAIYQRPDGTYEEMTTTYTGTYGFGIRDHSVSISDDGNGNISYNASVRIGDSDVHVSNRSFQIYDGNGNGVTYERYSDQAYWAYTTANGNHASATYYDDSDGSDVNTLSFIDANGVYTDTRISDGIYSNKIVNADDSSYSIDYYLNSSVFDGAYLGDGSWYSGDEGCYSTTVINSEGTTTSSYTLNGGRESNYVTNADGSYSRETIELSGQIYTWTLNAEGGGTYTSTDGAGNVTVFYFDDNGTEVARYTQSPDRSYLVGARDSGGNWTFSHYDANGVLATTSYVNADGSYGSATVNADGSANWTINAGNDGNNTLAGGSGSDMLIGAAGADTMAGGAGNDTLNGGEGGDTYAFGLGDGVDVVQDSGTTGTDTIAFGEGITSESLSLSLGSLLIKVGNGNDAIHIQNFNQSNVYGSPNIENFKFADGTILTYSELVSRGFDITGADRDDTLSGTNVTDRIHGLNGRDVLNGGNGDDALYGDAGNDTLNGGAGSDTLDGGVGNDTLNGAAGNDMYLYSRGAGSDTITDDAGTDVVRFAPDITANDVQISRDYYHLYLNIKGTSDRLSLQYWFYSDQRKVERVEFADGTVWGIPELTAGARFPTENADYLVGTTGNDSMSGLGGDDTMEADAGSDTLEGGTGNDYINGGAGNDLYLFKRGDGADSIVDYDSTVGNVDTIRFADDIAPGDVQVKGDQHSLYLNIRGTTDRLQLMEWLNADQFKVERVEFADGTVWNVQDLVAASLVGTEEVDTLAGISGNDTFAGLGGNDTMLGNGGNDTLDGGAGDDSMYGDDSFGGYGYGGNLSGLDVLYGGGGNDYLEGGAGADSLAGGTGNDTLQGGIDNDYLQGDSGDDVYLFKVGDGADTIHDDDATAGNTDAIRFDVGIAAADIEVTREQGNLRLSIKGTSDQLILQSWFDSDRYKIERVEFADGAVWTVQDLNAVLPEPVPGVYLEGRGGRDTLIGGAGNDTLDGGAGQDGMYGGNGDDIYIVNNRRDVIVENANEGIDSVSSRVSYTLSDNVENLTLTGNGNLDATGNGLNNILAGNNRKNVLDGSAGADTMIGGDGDDTYVVDNTDDVVTESAGEGVDTVESSADHTLSDNVENLTLTGNVAMNGFGNALDNTLIGNSNANLLEGYAGNDTIQGNAANDILRGWDGNDVLRDTGGSNLLDGGTGGDTLTGNSGNELFIGGAGNDTITTGTGNDIIAFNRGDGQDTVVASKGQDNTISLGGGIRYEDIAFRKSSNDLILELGDTDQLTLKNWYSGQKKHSALNLQVIVDAMAGYDVNSTNPLLTKRIEQFNFAGLVGLFDQARTRTPQLTRWTLMNSLLDMHLAGSDDVALGGDLAYQYGRNGALAGVSLGVTQNILNDSLFGSQPQTLQLATSSQPSISI